MITAARRCAVLRQKSCIVHDVFMIIWYYSSSVIHFIVGRLRGGTQFSTKPWCCVRHFLGCLLRWKRLIPTTPEVLRPPPPLAPQQSMQTRRASLRKDRLLTTSVGGFLLPSLQKRHLLATPANGILLRKMNGLRFNASKLRLPRMHRFGSNAVAIFKCSAPPASCLGTARVGYRYLEVAA